MKNQIRQATKNMVIKLKIKEKMVLIPSEPLVPPVEFVVPVLPDVETVRVTAELAN